MKIDFGLHFFPDFGPEDKSARDTFQDYLKIVDLVDELGFKVIRIVEHYFENYGGYSPNPLLFLSAASQRSQKAQIMPGAMLPVFNNPLKMAGEIAMLDAISDGRLEVGFARAFLPHEFERFGIDMEESRARFDEGVEAVRRLLEDKVASFEGKFVNFKDIPSLPRPTQLPRPAFWIAVLATPQSFIEAGKKGYYVMANPLAGPRMADLLAQYRKAWKEAGHPGNGKVMISFRMFCLPDHKEAYDTFRAPVMAHLNALVAGATVVEGWGTGKKVKDYPGYEAILNILKNETYDEQIEKHSTWVGTPAEVKKQIEEYYTEVGGFDIASLNGLPWLMPLETSKRSLRTFAAEVMPAFR